MHAMEQKIMALFPDTVFAKSSAKIVLQYKKNAAEALIEDKGLKILQYLKKKAGITKETLKEFRDKYADLVNSHLVCDKKMKSTFVMVNLKEKEYQLEHFESKIDALEEKIHDKKNLLRHLNSEYKLKKLQQKLKSFLGHEIIIILPTKE